MGTVNLPTPGQRIEELEAENARLREHLSTREADVRTEQHWVTHWKEKCDKLQEELAAAQADAARHKFMRYADLDAMRDKYWPEGEVPTGAEYDAAIDSAMK